MNSAQIILGALVLVPVLLLMVLRINATLVFLSLCLGAVLVQFVAPETNTFINLFSSHTGKPINANHTTIELALLLLPVVLTTFFMVRTVKGHGKLALNTLPAAGVGLLGSLLVVPLLPGGISHEIVHSSLWDQVQKAQTLIVGISALICLFVLWLQRPKTGEDGKHGKHKR
jgi:hypothetical protein